jgi:4-hydroxy-tetrahydrodipicolinate synthase
MHSDGSIDWAAWERLLELHAESGTAGVVVGGSTGESVTLTEGELLALLERARPKLQGRAALIAAVGGSSTAATVERVHRVCAAGVDGLLVVTPSYNRPTQEGLYRHFEAVAAASSVPVVLYNVPARTGADVLPTTVARLARLPRIVGIKEAAPGLERIRELLATTRPEALGDTTLRDSDQAFSVLSGDDLLAVDAMLLGARGVISVTANIVPKAMAQLCAAALRGDAMAAGRINGSLAALHAAMFVESNPIPVKWALAELGLIEAGIRLPLTPLSESLHATVRAALEPARRRSSESGGDADAPKNTPEPISHADPVVQARFA